METGTAGSQGVVVVVVVDDDDKAMLVLSCQECRMADDPGAE
jgi:hypothetical protein